MSADSTDPESSKTSPAEKPGAHSEAAAHESLYSRLEAAKVLSTVRKLRARIEERFSERGIRQVCLELEKISSRSQERIEWIEKPIWVLRIARYALLFIIVGGLAMTFMSLRPAANPEPLTAAEFIQTLEAGLNDVVMISLALFFIWTLEARVKRRRALHALHELRSIAHVIDMHQLTKDPDRVLFGRSAGEVEPEDDLSPFDLRRYLDYCSEMLSLTGKVAALHLQTLDDSTVVAAVNEIEDLTTGLCRKIWQKIDMVRSDTPESA